MLITCRHVDKIQIYLKKESRQHEVGYIYDVQMINTIQFKASREQHFCSHVNIYSVCYIKYVTIFDVCFTFHFSKVRKYIPI